MNTKEEEARIKRAMPLVQNERDEEMRMACREFFETLKGMGRVEDETVFLALDEVAGEFGYAIAAEHIGLSGTIFVRFAKESDIR